MFDNSRPRRTLRFRATLAGIALLGLLAAVFGVWFPSLPGSPPEDTQVPLQVVYGGLPLSFEVNQGQMDQLVRFASRGGGYTLLLTPSEAVLALNKPSAPLETEEPAGTPLTVISEQGTHDAEYVALKWLFLDANPDPAITGLDELPGKSNYFIGNDPSRWHTDIAHYAKVRYGDIYPGVDLVYYGSQGQLEYDLVIAPGADPTAIRLGFEGSAQPTLDAHGNLILGMPGGEVIQQAPVIYQEIGGARQEISGR